MICLLTVFQCQNDNTSKLTELEISIQSKKDKHFNLSFLFSKLLSLLK